MNIPVGVWPDESDILAIWPDAADLEEDAISVLARSAQAQCEAYAPVLADGATVPGNYKHAVIMQMRNLWNATETNSEGNMGEPGTYYQPRPMDWFVTSLLRPKPGRPVIG
jgi:hypothetical protein